MFINNADLRQVPPWNTSTKETINGLLVQFAYEVIISKILKETILFGVAVGSTKNCTKAPLFSRNPIKTVDL